MELISSQDNKRLTDPESSGLQTEISTVEFIQRKRSTFFNKRNFIILTLVFIIILIFVIILLTSLKTCSKSESGRSPFSQIRPSQYRDKNNRPCFYQEIRLPKSIIPNNYSIYIHPNITQVKWKNFTGHVTIEGKCNSSTDFVVLHAKSLTVYNPQIQIEDQIIPILIISICPKLDQYYLKFSRICKNNEKIKIKLSFNGTLEKRLDGFYLSDYKTKSGLEKTLITTHMEPTFARQAFPCFDEPYFKANFSMKMIRDKDHHSLFNMPIKSIETLENGMFCDVYETSVKMSTYLVAYMLLPLDYISLDGYAAGNRTKIRIFAPKDQKDYTNYALEISQKVLPFFENLFGIDYPLPKLDMIAIPDFSAGAMENWGLITYKFFTLLLNPKNPKIQHKTSIAKIISHEIAHQWFGNIVTMDWWNDLWLNEGFATYSEYLAGDYINKEWGMIGHFYLEQFTDALSFDSLLNSHPIQVPVKDPQEIESIFDQISYGKGASLVRMLEGVLGLETLKVGLKIYLQRYRYQTAVSDNLWTAFSEAYSQSNRSANDNNNPVTRLQSVMSTWLNQMNFPLVTLSRTGSKSFRITQERFLLYPNASKLWKSNYTAAYNYVWSIPILYQTDTMNTTNLIWLDMKQSQDFELAQEFKWIKLNVGHTGFYRVNYDNQSWFALIHELRRNYTQFSNIDRSGLLSDAFTLVRAGKLSIEIAMELSLYLKNETHYIPWSIATQVFTDINKQLYFDDSFKMMFEKFGRELINQVLKDPRLGSWTTDNLTPYETLTRLVVMQFAIIYQHNETIKEAVRLYKQYKLTKQPINSNLHFLTLYAGITEGDKQEWNFLYKKLKKTRDADVQRGLRKALAKTRNIELLNKLFYTMINKHKVQDVISALYDASHSQSVGIDQAWLFIQRNWDYFEKNFSQYFLIMDLFKICYGLMTETDYQQAKTFFSTKELGFGDRSAKQALEIIKSNIFWNKINADPLRNWLNQYFKTNQTKKKLECCINFRNYDISYISIGFDLFKLLFI